MPPSCLADLLHLLLQGSSNGHAMKLLQMVRNMAACLEVGAWDLCLHPKVTGSTAPVAAYIQSKPLANLQTMSWICSLFLEQSCLSTHPLAKPSDQTIQTILIPCSMMVEQPSELCLGRGNPLFLQKSLDDTACLRTPPLPTQLIYLLSPLTSPLFLSLPTPIP